MADFSVNATQLSAPQGAGATPLPPVQETVTRDNPLAGVSEAVTGLITSIGNSKKAEAADRKSKIMQEYGQKLETINQGVAQGKGTTWAAQQRWALTGQYVGAYGDLASEIMEVNKAFDGTALSKIDQEQKRQDAIAADRTGRAVAQGHVVYEGMSPQALEATLVASDTERRLEFMQDRDRKRKAEGRAEAAEGRAAYDHRTQQETAGMLSEIAANNFDAIQTKVADLRAKVTSGAMDPVEAQALLNKDIQRVRAGTLAVASQNPALAGPWVTLLTDMESNAIKLFDPNLKDSQEATRLENQLRIASTRTQLMAIKQDPSLLGLYSTSKLLGENVVLELARTGKATDALALLTQNAQEVTAGMPQVVGTGDDIGVYNGIKGGLQQIPKMDAADRPQAQTEAVNVVNNMLKQTADSTGAIPAKSLNKAADFYASREFYDLMKTGRIDPTTARNAQQVFQMQYVPMVQTAILERLNTEVLGVGTTGGNVGMRKLGDSVDFKFDGNAVNITFNSAVQGVAMGPAGRERQLVKEASVGLNTLVRLHANLEGTDNYQKYWEDNKHIFLPNYFPDPNKVQEGSVVNGYKYMGGNYRNRNNWQPVGK